MSLDVETDSKLIIIANIIDWLNSTLKCIEWQNLFVLLVYGGKHLENKNM